MIQVVRKGMEVKIETQKMFTKDLQELIKQK